MQCSREVELLPPSHNQHQHCLLGPRSQNRPLWSNFHTRRYVDLATLPAGVNSPSSLLVPSNRCHGGHRGRIVLRGTTEGVELKVAFRRDGCNVAQLFLLLLFSGGDPRLDEHFTHRGQLFERVAGKPDKGDEKHEEAVQSDEAAGQPDCREVSE